MIPLITTTLLLASSALSLGTHGGVRKSLSFGPKHPTAKLNVPTERVDAASFGLAKRAHCGHNYDPKEVASSFVQRLYGNGAEFRIREDSYTDDRTGVSHIYVRQLVNGVEVMDGDINVNVRDGEVLSYGDSFYRGEAPTYAMDPSSLLEPMHDQSHHCEALSSYLTSFLAVPTGQVTLNPDHPTVEDEELLALLQAHNCPSAPLDAGEPELLVDPSVSALNFMLFAAPDDESSADIKDNYGAHLMTLAVIPTESLISTAPAVEIHDVPHTTGSVKAELAYVQTPHPEEEGMTVLNLAWHLTVPMEDNAYEAFMSATRANRLISVVDWVSDAYVPIPKPGKEMGPTYNVWAWGINDPSVGNRSMESSYDKTASPIGWHAMPSSASPYGHLKPKKPEDDEDPMLNFTTTWGNNVFAHENLDGRNEWEFNQRPDAGSDMVFDYSYLPEINFTNTSPRDYLNLSVTQLFYTANMIHDIYYRYGFDEKSGNFQQHNFGKGGKGSDAVICNAQDGSGYNNANFMTPPDGQNGKMRMYVWNTAKPWRDGDLEAGIVIHEYSHGLSTRLTGGPANSGCLGWGEAGGMGEGWGDFFATTIRSTSTYSDYAMGSWAANRPTGIRNYMYSLNMTVNPSTYKTLDKPGYWGVHAIGEVWAQILWIVENRLIKVHGFGDTLFPPEALKNGTIPEGDFYRPAQFDKKGKRLPLIPKHGNTLAFQLVIDGMKLQPCRPSFFDARDAILQADEILTGGENKCEIWKGFAERGLGPDASLKGGTPWGGGIRSDDFTLPRGACKVVEDPEDPPADPEDPEDPPEEEERF